MKTRLGLLILICPNYMVKKAKPREAKKAKIFLNSLIANQEFHIRRFNYDR